MDDNNGAQSFLAFLIGLILGGLIGAAVALLYAPQSGEETRAAIRDKSIELKEQAMEQATVLRDQAQQQITSLQQQVSDLQARLQKVPPPEATPPVAN
jgi:gas vesicle protein